VPNSCTVSRFVREWVWTSFKQGPSSFSADILLLDKLIVAQIVKLSAFYET
jgi:hypothetical protein